MIFSQPDAYFVDSKLVSPLHEEDFFLPREIVRRSTHQILCLVALITLLQISLYHIIAKLKQGRNDETKRTMRDVDVTKVSYQVTNMIVNGCLGCFGVYHFAGLPALDQVTVTERIEGLPHLNVFGVAQIAYQTWAIPMGLFFCGESAAMIVHHVAVIGVSSFSVFGANGCRYHSPFFYGVVEITSVPLAVMNVLKTNPSLKIAFPTLFNVVKLCFAVMFLFVRVYKWLPQMWDLQKNLLLLTVTSKSWITTVYHFKIWFFAIFLTALQLWWAYLVVKGFRSMFSRKNEKVD